jgi:hypothetical protein
MHDRFPIIQSGKNPTEIGWSRNQRRLLCRTRHQVEKKKVSLIARNARHELFLRAGVIENLLGSLIWKGR